MLLKKPGQFAVGSATQSGAGLLDLNFLNSDATLSNTITHSRAGNATMVASDGLIKWAPHNLVTYSEDFSDSDWTKNDSSIQSNVIISPDGTLTGDKIVENTNTTWHGVSQPSASLTSGTTYTATFFVKKAERSIVQILFGSSTHGLSAYANFDILNGVLGTVSGGTASITNIGNNWYRISYSSTATSTATGGALCAIVLSTTSARVQSYPGDGTSGIYIWGAHLYRSDLGGMAPVPAGERSFPSASTYVPTTSSARYLPRVGHHVYNGSAWVNEGLLAESEARTNLVTYSEDFTDASWGTSNASVTKKTGITAPDGTENVYHFQEDATNNQHRLNSSVTAGEQVFSVYAKGDGSGRYLKILGYGLGSASEAPIFDVDNGILYEPPTSTHFLSASIQDAGNGWYRCALRADTDGGPGTPQFALVNATDSHGGVAYTGDGTSGVYLYGAQIEATSGQASSYIPTAGSTVTRAAETFLIPAANLPWPTETYGPELVTNGTFDADSDWTKEGTWAIAAGIASHGSGNNDDLYQQVNMIAGNTYIISFDIANRSVGTVSVRYNGNVILSGQPSGSPSFTFTADATNLNLEFRALNNFDGDIDNISVRELTRYPVSIQMNGRLNYADEGSAGQVTYAQWEDDTNNRITLSLDTDSTATGEVNFTQVEGGTADTVASSATEYAPGILVPFNIASRHGMTFINGAVDGVALTEDTTPTNLPDLSATDLDLAYDYMGTVERFRVWGVDLGDGGIEDATTGEPASYVIWDQANDDYVQRIFQ